MCSAGTPLLVHFHRLSPPGGHCGQHAANARPAGHLAPRWAEFLLHYVCRGPAACEDLNPAGHAGGWRSTMWTASASTWRLACAGTPMARRSQRLLSSGRSRQTLCCPRWVPPACKQVQRHSLPSVFQPACSHCGPPPSPPSSRGSREIMLRPCRGASAPGCQARASRGRGRLVMRRSSCWRSHGTVEGCTRSAASPTGTSGGSGTAASAMTSGASQQLVRSS